MASIADLFNLQKVDYNAIKIKKRFEQIQKALGSNKELAVAHKQVADAEAQLHQQEATQRDQELESQSLASRIEETEKQLMSGSVSNHKELESLQASLDSLKRQKETIETSSVETLVEVDKLTKNLTGLRAQLESMESAWNDKVLSLKTDGKKLQQQFQLLKKKRKSITQGLDEQSLQLYDQLRKRKAGVAIAPLTDDTCGACNMQVPSGVISSVRTASSEPVYCPSCGRILFAN
ncbi:MAG: C4-type zinc ribbon domain-containing protein [Chloroflexota bacterium]